jgi:hypothetical protein
MASDAGRTMEWRSDLWLGDGIGEGEGAVGGCGGGAGHSRPGPSIRIKPCPLRRASIARHGMAWHGIVPDLPSQSMVCLPIPPL